MRIQLNASELARVNQRISEYAKTVDKDVSRVFVLTLLSQIFGDQLEEALNKVFEIKKQIIEETKAKEGTNTKQSKKMVNPMRHSEDIPRTK